MSFHARIAIGALLTIAAGACSLPKTNEPVVMTAYDFGPPATYKSSNPGIAATIALPSVTATTALDDGIVYRLLYEDRGRPQIYTMSRWAGDPAALLTDRLRSRLAAVARGVVTPLDSTRSDYTLRVELRDFSQEFESREKSRGVLRARATLIATVERTLIGQRDFEIERPAAPNAEGAVKALTEATDAFIEELVKWTGQNLKGKGSG